ncbi:hypothetical protein HK104_000771 [Borealophlyctis nickersoniae]|nr:hypothetical protein HK104_000771 [Borealophlyctis nickersoniae]
MARRLRETAEKVQKEVEEPVTRSITEHIANVEMNEKRLVQMGKDIQDKIKKAESETRKKKSRDPDQLQKALKNLSTYTSELHDLRFIHQQSILAEETRNVKNVQSHWSNLLRFQGDVLMRCGTNAARLSDELMGKYAATSSTPTPTSSRTASPSPVNGTTLPRGAMTPSPLPRPSDVGEPRISLDRGRGVSMDAPRQSWDKGPVSVAAAGTLPQQTTTVQQQQQQPSPSQQQQQQRQPVITYQTSLANIPREAAKGASAASPPKPTPMRRGSLDSNTGSYAEAAGQASNSLGTAGPLVGSLSLESRSGRGSPVQNLQSALRNHQSLPRNNSSDILGNLRGASSQPTPPGSPEPGQKKRVRFPHQKPIATVAREDDDDDDATSLEIPMNPTNATPQNLTSTLSSLYPHIFASESSQLWGVPVQKVALTSGPTQVRTPEVYVSPEADVESQMGSVVGVSESLVGLPPTADMVYAIHDFAARSAKEMSLTKGDVVTVRKRQGTWIYGTKVPRSKPSPTTADSSSNPASKDNKDTNNNKSFADRFRRGPPQAASSPAEVGWIPMAFVAKFSPK